MTRRTPSQYDWANCLFDDTRLGISSGTGIRHYTSPRRDQIRFIVAHHMTIIGDGTGKALNGCWNTWQNRQASAHYGVEENLVRQYVSDNDAAWACANTYGNHAGISIEHANSTGASTWKVSDTTWKTGARLAAHLHKLYDLGRPVKNVTLRRHHDFYATACPGPYLDSIWSQYVAEAQRVYDQITGAVAPAPTPAPTPEPEPLPVPVWGKPETWKLGATGPDVLRLGERINAWNAVLGLPTWTPDDNFSSTERNALQKLQVAWDFGSSASDLAAGGASDGYPGALTFTKLGETPVATPTTSTVDISVMFLPTAGYNAATARGVTAWRTNTKGLAGLVNTHKPDLVGTTELSNRSIDPMRPLFDSLVTGHAREPGGTDGRYIYRRKATTNHIASGHVTASNASELNDDDKQAAWAVVEIDGVRVRIISAHTENEDGIDRSSGINADTLRVTQAISLETRARIAMAPHAPVDSPIIYVGDFNSEGLVRDAMVARGWRVAGYGYFTRWDDSAKKPFDWVFIKGGTATVRRINHAFGDHTALDITWTVPK